MLTAENLSVLVCASQKEKLSATLDSLQRLLPLDSLLVSLWQGETLTLPKEVPILSSPRPISVPTADAKSLLTYNEALTLRRLGLKQIKTDYVLILDAGVTMQSLNFLNLLGESSTMRIPFLQEKVLIPSARYGTGRPIPFFFGNWIQAGRREDLLALWDIPNLDLRSLGALTDAKQAVTPFPQESALLLSALQDSGLFPSLEGLKSPSSCTPATLRLSEAILAGAFRLVPPQQFACKYQEKRASGRDFYSERDLCAITQEISHA